MHVCVYMLHMYLYICENWTLCIHVCNLMLCNLHNSEIVLSNRIFKNLYDFYSFYDSILQ